MKKRRNFRLGDARGNTFHRKKARQLTPTHYTGAKADGLEGTSRAAIDHCRQNSRCSGKYVSKKKSSPVDPHSLYWRKGRRSRGHQPRCDRPLPTKFTLRREESSSHCNPWVIKSAKPPSRVDKIHAAASGKFVALQLLGLSRVPSPRPP